MYKNTLRSTDEFLKCSGAIFLHDFSFGFSKSFLILRSMSLKPDTLEGDFLHEEVHVMVDLEAVQVVCVSLEPHQEAAVRHVCREPTSSRVGG